MDVLRFARRQRCGCDVLDRLFGGGLRKSFRIAAAVGVFCKHVDAALHHGSRAIDVLGPRAVVGHVEIDPGDEVVPGLGVEFHIVVAALEHLHQFAGVDMIFQGFLHMIIAFRAGAAHERMQGDVGFGEIVVTVLLVGGEVGHRLAVNRLGAVLVATHAVFVQHRLHLAFEIKAAGRSIPWRDRRGRALAGQGRFARRNGILGVVTANAGKTLARHCRIPAAHELQRLALGIERLHGNGRVGGHLEARRAVCFHRHRAENAMDVPRAVDADIDMATHALIGKVRFVEADFFHRAARHPGESRALIDVRQIDGGVFFG